MAKKIAIAGVVLVLVAGFLFMSMRRSHMMGAGGAGAGSDLVAVSSDGQPLPAPASAGSQSANVAVQQAGDLVVTLSIDPYPPTVGGNSKFDVTLADTNGKAVTDADIQLDLTMPSMWMPPNQPGAKPLSEGTYRAEAPFTMRGMWRIEVIITRGSQTQSVFFDIGL